MIKQWEEFDEGPGDRGTELHVSLDRKGTITLGAGTVKKLGSIKQVVLMFDRVNSLIGIRPASSVTKNAYPLIEKKGAGHKAIRGNRFCRNYGIEVPRTIAFKRPEIDEDGVLVLDIKKTRTIGKKR